ncbi:aminotransferase class V-fold PLP-dependent enzyme [Carnimonas bestiolae]|uniref:aminotransferase class V-fold PLP-dependent enzyme n=1 Tax=Carnimonas bestiolae TaxID=3402172 RepID=UPI003F4AC5B1
MMQPEATDQTPSQGTQATFDVEALRAQFPILARKVNDDRPLIYFDNAATSQTPQAVIDALDNYYHRYNANIHRGLHSLADEATAAFEGARECVQRHINASDKREIVFTRGTTEAINLVAQSYGRAFLEQGDEVIISMMEHHSNIVPWQLLAAERGVVVKVIPVTESGELDIEAYQALLSERTRLVCVNHVSNVLGTINPIQQITELAHAHGAKVLVDGAQGLPHAQVDVQALDVDFYAMSAHKVYGPTGIGALYARLELLEAMPPWQGGGEMIQLVKLDGTTTFAAPPHKFEAGTPAIAEAVAFGAALEWFEALPFAAMEAWERQLTAAVEAEVNSIEGARIIGTAPGKTGVVSFVIDGVHSQDIGLLIDQFGVAIRTGHHCAQPLLASYGLEASCRASVAPYNTLEEVATFGDALRRVVGMVRD